MCLGVVAVVAGAVAVPAGGAGAGSAAVGPAAGSASAAGTEAGDVPTAAELSAALPPDVENLSADSTSFEVAVESDGTAVWTVQYRVQLDDEATTEAFENASERIDRAPLRYTGPFKELIEESAAVASEETGREMVIRNVSVRARKFPNGVGAVTYRFEWTGFAATPGNRIETGDALAGFDVRDEESKLFVQWPSGYEAETVRPAPDDQRNRTVVWEGPVEFGPNEPEIVVVGGPLQRVPVTPALTLIAVLAVGAVGWLWRRGDAPAAGDGEAGAAVADADEGVPEELLSDAERVINLLEANGGRMKQQDVVGELEWSETKTSQVVNDLEDDEKIEVYRIGRENVLSLPGEMDV